MKQGFKATFNAAHREHNYSKSAIPYTIRKSNYQEESLAARSHYGFKKLTGIGGLFRTGNYISRITHKKSASITQTASNSVHSKITTVQKGETNYVRASKTPERLPNVIIVSKPQEVISKGDNELSSTGKFTCSMQKLTKAPKFKKYSHNRSKSDQLLLQQYSKRTLKDNTDLLLLQENPKQRKHVEPTQISGEVHHSLQNPGRMPVVSGFNGSFKDNVGKFEVRSSTSNHSPKNDQRKDFWKSRKLEAVIQKNTMMKEVGRERLNGDYQSSAKPKHISRPASETSSQTKEQKAVHTSSTSKERPNIPPFVHEVEKVQKPHKSGIVLANYVGNYVKKCDAKYLEAKSNSKSTEPKRDCSVNKRAAKAHAIKLIMSRKRRNQSGSNNSGDSALIPIRLVKKNAPASTVTDLPANLEVKIPANNPSLPSMVKELNLDGKRKKEMLETVKAIRSKLDNPKTELQFYKIGKILGKGAFGRVSLGIHKLTGKLVAIKSISKRIMTDEASKNKVMREFSIWEKLQHPSVIQLYEVFESEKHLLYVQELCAGGDLLIYVRKRRKLKESVAKFILKQILEGLHYCHLKSILHRDIKLDNILLNSDGKIKICDFGVSKVVTEGERMTEKCGTPTYIAPEILLNKGYEGFGVDVWSAGVVLFAMIYGTVPFKASTMPDLHKLIIKGKYKLRESASESVRDLLRKMLEVNPKRRLTIPQILCHKWFCDYDPNISLFTEEEKMNIEKEFTSSQRTNRNQLREGVNTVDSDWFIERNIDSSQSDLTRNMTSKSVILAPFNSTRTHQSHDSEESKENVQERKVLRLGVQVKDADRQYEKNYNCDVDNGVYNNFGCDTERRSDSRSDLNPFGDNTGSDEESQCAEPEANPSRSKAVHEILMNSLMPKPLVVGNFKQLT